MDSILSDLVSSVKRELAPPTPPVTEVAAPQAPAKLTLKQMQEQKLQQQYLQQQLRPETTTFPHMNPNTQPNFALGSAPGLEAQFNQLTLDTSLPFGVPAQVAPIPPVQAAPSAYNPGYNPPAVDPLELFVSGKSSQSTLDDLLNSNPLPPPPQSSSIGSYNSGLPIATSPQASLTQGSQPHDDLDAFLSNSTPTNSADLFSHTEIADIPPPQYVDTEAPVSEPVSRRERPVVSQEPGAVGSKECKMVQVYGGLHRLALDNKKVLEKQCQELHGTLWSFPVQEKTLEGTCGCSGRVSYTYNFRLATFSLSCFENLSGKFLELHNFNIDTVFMSLFQQTFAELQLSRLIHSQLPRIQTISNLAELLREAKILLDPLFGVLANPTYPLSGHSKVLIQALILYIGSYLSTRSQARQKVPEAFEGVAIVQSNVQDNSAIQDQIVLYFLHKFSEIRGFSWGSNLVQISVSQMERLQILHTVVTNLVKFQDTPEIEFINFLRQIPWKDIPDISSSNVVYRDILVPLRQIIDYASLKSFLSLQLFVGNILLSCAYEFTDVSFDCINAITASNRSMKLVCSSILQYAPLFTLQKEHLVSIFGNLYGLQQPPLDYAKLSEIERLAHRQEFVRYILNYPLPAELLDPNNRSVQYQPILGLFYQLAGHATPGSQFQRLVAQELFFLGFSLVVDQMATSPLQQELLYRFSYEARTYLENLLQNFPTLLSTFIFCIGHNLMNINLHNLIGFLKPSTFAGWSLDLYSTNWIGYFFAHRNFPQFPSQTIAGDSRVFEALIQMYLRSGPTVQMHPNSEEAGRVIGNRLLEVIDWSCTEPAIRFYSALIIIGAKPFMLPSYSLNIFVGPVGRKLLSAPFDELFTQAILSFNPQTYPATAVDVTFMQLILALGILEERYRNNRLEHKHIAPNTGHSWLVSWGFYARLESLLTEEFYPFVAKLFIPMDVLKEEALDAALYVKQIITSISTRRLNNTTIQTFQAALLESLRTNSLRDSSDESNAKRLSFWLHTLYPPTRKSKLECTLLNDLFAFSYCSGYPLQESASLVQSKNYTRDDIIGLRSDGYHWIVLLTLYTYQPTFSHNAKDKNNALFLLRDTATQQAKTPVAVALWLHFFMIYFNANNPNLIPKADQDTLNKHFVAVAKYYEELDRTLYRLYYAFSAWKKAILDSATGDFHEEQNIQLLASVYSLLPPHFQVIPELPDEAAPPRKTFQATATEATIQALDALLPQPSPSPQQQLPPELDQYTALEQGIKNEINYIWQMNLQQTYGRLPALQSIQSLLSLLQQYEITCNQLGEYDLGFLELCKLSHYNHPSPFQVRVPCSKGAQCAVPAIIQGNSVVIEPANPNVLPNIEQNRSTYNAEYLKFFDLARGLAQVVVLICSTSEISCGLCQNQSLQQLHPGGPQEVSPSCAANLFFTILDQCVLSNKLPSGSPIVSHLVELLLAIGRKNIKNIRTYQLQLLNALITAPTQVISPVQNKSLEITMPQFASNNPMAPPEFDAEPDYHPTLNSSPEERSHVPADLYELFTPQCFVTAGDTKTYFELLQTVVRCESKSDKELEVLAASFNPDAFILTLGNSPSSADVDVIFSIIPDLLARRPLAAIGSAFLQYIVSIGHQRKAMGLLFSESVPTKYAKVFIDNLNLSRVELDSCTSMIQNFISWLPLAPHHVEIGIEFVRRVTVSAHSFVEQFIKENPASHDAQGKPINSPLWNLLYEIFSNKGIIRENIQFSDTQIASVLDLLYEIASLVPASLCDKLWYLLSGSILPGISARMDQGQALGKTEAVISRFASGFPWHTSRILLFDRNALPLLSRLVLHHYKFVSGLFTALDWGVFLSRLSTSNQVNLISELGLMFLKLFLLINTVSPQAISSTIRAQTIPATKPAEQQQLFLDWSKVHPEIFAKFFTGNVLLAPLRARFITADPTAGLVDNCSSLRAIAMKIQHPVAILACMREVRSLLFFALDCGSGNYWYLPFPTQLGILANVMIPLAHQYGSVDAQNEGKLIVQQVLSVVDHRVWARPTVVPCSFGSSRSYPDGSDSDPSFEQFFEKTKGLVLQFCGAATPVLALNILQGIPPPRLEYQDNAEGSISSGLWCEHVEMTLRTFFGSCNIQNPLGVASRALALNPALRIPLFQACVQSSSVLTIIVIIEQWKAEIAPSHPSTQWPPEFFDTIISFQPAQYRSFDYLPLWFSFLDLVSSPRYHPIQCQSESKKFMTYIKELYSNPKLEPQIYLAARAVEIYFFRLIREKNAGPNPKGDGILIGLVDKLASLKDQNPYKNYQGFFAELENLLSPIFTLENLKLCLLSTLVPTAQPMLEKLFS